VSSGGQGGLELPSHIGNEMRHWLRGQQGSKPVLHLRGTGQDVFLLLMCALHNNIDGGNVGSGGGGGAAAAAAAAAVSHNGDDKCVSDHLPTSTTAKPGALPRAACSSGT
jgi:hypothetical protein